MQDPFRKQSWIRITLVVIALAAAAAVVTGEIVRSAAERKQREAILAELQPVALKNCTLKRFGSANDGGYLMCENLIEPLDTGYSYGVGTNDDWGCEVSRRYHVPVHQYDCFDPARPTCDGGRFIFHNECVGNRTGHRDSHFFDTLENQISKNGDTGRRMIIKMDIEGGEWESLLAVPDELLASIPQLAMEMHGFDDPKILEVLRKLKRNFYLVNLHFNNWSCTPKAAPLPAWAYQALWVNKRIGIVDPTAPVPAPMSPLNAPDSPTWPDCQLPVTKGGALNVSERLPFDQMQSQSFQTCDEFVSGNYGEQQNPSIRRSMKTDDLESVARKLVAPGKGILAADESSGTIEKRLKSINVPSNEENRRMYREILFTTNGADEFISGVILFDETIRQKTRDGRSFVEVLEQQGIVPGIKVDKGAKAMTNFPGEKITEGLDGLRERLTEYRKLGARFAKWRAVITIGDGIPTRTCIDSNAEALARYAALCQEGDLVPIVEPEVLMDGTHTMERHFQVTEQTLRSVFDSLAEHRVVLEGILLKPNMVLSGKENPQQASVQEVAEATVCCLKRVVPAAVPGIVFLSGGQTDQQATEHLNAMNRMGDLPWQLSFSYGRALQAPVLKAWKGDTANVSAAQTAFHHRAWCNSKARFGKYTEEMETARAA